MELQVDGAEARENRVDPIHAAIPATPSLRFRSAGSGLTPTPPQ